VSSHGRLAGKGNAPSEGEETVVLARADGFTVEHILSGRLPVPQAYVQDHDEWVVVLAGGATLEVDGVEHELTGGDWWSLPAGIAHTLVRTEPGTSWLAVRSTT
jgi:cupin 2 domain-containing protein